VGSDRRDPIPTTEANSVDGSPNLLLENYTFLTPCVEIKKANLYRGFHESIVGRFSNAAVETLLEEMIGDLLQADFWPGITSALPVNRPRSCTESRFFRQQEEVGHRIYVVLVVL